MRFDVARSRLYLSPISYVQLCRRPFSFDRARVYPLLQHVFRFECSVAPSLVRAKRILCYDFGAALRLFSPSSPCFSRTPPREKKKKNKSKEKENNNSSHSSSRDGRKTLRLVWLRVLDVRRLCVCMCICVCVYVCASKELRSCVAFRIDSQHDGSFGIRRFLFVSMETLVTDPLQLDPRCPRKTFSIFRFVPILFSFLANVTRCFRYIRFFVRVRSYRFFGEHRVQTIVENTRLEYDGDDRNRSSSSSSYTEPRGAFVHPSDLRMIVSS